MQNTNLEKISDHLQTAEIKSPKSAGNNLDPNRKRTVGYVVHCDSKKALISAEVDPSIEHMENYWAVGQLISVGVGKNRVIGQSFKVDTGDTDWSDEGRNKVQIHIELIGEIKQLDSGAKFTTGISSFPTMGCEGHRIRSSDLAAIFENSSDSTIDIGHITQDQTIPAKIDYEKLLSRHFAVVGSTGVGKSTSVSLMLRKVVNARPDLRILMLDPHNEFSTAFPRNSVVTSAKELSLPFWLFGLEELSEVIFRGQDGVETDKEMLRDFVVLAKERYTEGEQDSKNLVRKTPKNSKSIINADTPIPYRIADLLKLIDERLGMLDGKSDKPILKSLKDRIETISNDARFQFMFDPSSCGGDRLNSIIAQLFRVPLNDKPISVVEMSGLPSEVVSSVVSVLCRMAFDLSISSQGAIQTLVVCEEAHRYIPADVNAGFWPTRQAIGRIAKEGRKYGVFLGIITQRPGELDPTILSQCNTFFAMRLSNSKDQEIIAGAFSSGAQSTISFLPSISNRECIAFGEAVYSPMRMTFETVEAKDLPGASIRENQEAVRAGKQINLEDVMRRMRGDSQANHQTTNNDLSDFSGSATTQPQLGDLQSAPKEAQSRVDQLKTQPKPVKNSTFRSDQLNEFRPGNMPDASRTGQVNIEQRYGALSANEKAPPARKPDQDPKNDRPITKTENKGNALLQAFRKK